MEKRDLIVLFVFIVFIIGVYLFYTNNKVNVLSSFPNANILAHEGKEYFNLHPTTCKLAPIYVQDILDNITSIFDGIFYSKPFLLCVRFGDTDYCLQSKVININNLSVVYFDKICMIERVINPNLPFVDIEYEKISSYKKLNKTLILKLAYFSDKKLYDALENS